MNFTSTKNSVSHYNSVDSYTGVTDASPHQLVQMLLEGALKKIAIVKGLMLRKEIAKKGEVMGQALAIIAGLRSSLDFSAGGDLAVNLDNIYEYVERRLLKANLENNVELLDESTRLINEIKAGWEAIPEESRSRPSEDISVAS